MRLDRIEAEEVGKRFGRRVVFTRLSASFHGGEVVAITGRNGSGKSTLLRILAGLLTPSSGRVTAYSNGSAMPSDAITPRTGFVAPYLNVYESFSARENLEFIARARGLPRPADRIAGVLGRVGLDAADEAPVSTYSSGMTQRVRLACAVLHEPAVLMLDEPTTNLDPAGRNVVRQMIADHSRGSGLVIVATNDAAEAALCDREIRITDFAFSTR